MIEQTMQVTTISWAREGTPVGRSLMVKSKRGIEALDGGEVSMRLKSVIVDQQRNKQLRSH